MKRVVMSLIILSTFIFLAGCVDYKAYDLQEKPSTELNLVDEIAEIEDQLAANEEAADVEEKIKEEEVILPELSEDDTVADVAAAVQEIMVKENQLVKLKPTIVDPDEDPITFTFSKPLNEQGQWQTNYGDAGDYLIILTASDGVLTTEKKIKLVVERVNVPPRISGVRDITVREGEVVTFEPLVTDPNKDAVTITVSEPLKSGTLATDHTSAGEYNIKVAASDGELESTEGFKLVVIDVNELPVITNVQDLTVKEGDVVEVKPLVTDLDEDEITLKISDPVGDDGVWETAYTDNGEYIVTITASDGKDTVTKKIKLLVEDVNKPPQIVDINLEVN